MKSDFLIAVTQLAAERNLPREIVLSAIEAALVSAYRKDSIAAGQNISVKLDPATGEVSVFTVKTVVEEVTDAQLEIPLAQALKINSEAKVGETVPTGTIAHSAGRIAAQTAKQVVMQRLREAERELVYQEYANKEGEVFSVNIQRVEPRQLVVDLGRAEALMPASEQVPYERYRPGQKIKVLLQGVNKTSKGPELIVSRADKQLVKRLFEMEVPEIFSGAVEVVTIAREPGARSKVAVRAKQTGVDPVGSCVGLRGVRIQNIVNELQGEKIDVVEWNKEPNKFIANALSPSQVLRVELDAETGSATVVVPDRHLSLAIGKEGQNARLAAKLTGWNVDIRSSTDSGVAAADGEKPAPRVTTAAGAGISAARRQAKEAVAVVAGPIEPQAAAEIEQAASQPAAAALPAATLPAAAQLQTADAPAAEVAVPVQVEVPTEEISPEALALQELEEPELEAEEVAAGAGEQLTSLRDLPEDVWSLRRAQAVEPGRIRFAEEIAGLRGGVTARRGRQRDEAPTKRGKRKKGR